MTTDFMSEHFMIIPIGFDDDTPEVVYLDSCPYCGTGPCRGSAKTANGRDVARFDRLHPSERRTETVV